MEQQDHHKKSGSSTPETDEDAEMFSAVLSTLDRQQLAILARSVLFRIHPDSPDTRAMPLVGDALFGSYHILFPLTFGTGLRWIIKIPINGTPGKWDSVSASALASEADTMRLLKRETTIPLPTVLDSSSTTANPLHCPYILMEFIAGRPLYDVWFGHQLQADVSSEMTRSRRIRALEGIAAAMAQLGRFESRTGGRPILAEDDTSVKGVGPQRRVDHQAMLDRWFVHKDPNNDPIYVECPVLEDPKKYYTFMLDLHPPSNPGFVEAFLSHFIDWIPGPTPEAAPFVLTHPDFDIQNFIVSDDGELLAIIDWDGVSAVPRAIGNESYPGWLTRDWDPAMYGYDESMDRGVEPVGVWEDSPTCLAHYRGLYAEMMARYRVGNGPAHVGDLCRMSLIMENISIAADLPQCRSGIVEKLVTEISSVSGADAGLDFDRLLLMFSDGEVDDAVLERVKEGFGILLSKKGL